jgi:hypothetical protein
MKAAATEQPLDVLLERLGSAAGDEGLLRRQNEAIGVGSSVHWRGIDTRNYTRRATVKI